MFFYRTHFTKFLKHSVLLLVFLLQDCAALTVRALSPESKCVRAFSGVKGDFSALKADNEDFDPLYLLIGVIDSPFSLAVDLILLPYDLLKECHRVPEEKTTNP